MAVLTPPFALGAAGQVLSGRLLRNSLGAVFLPGAGVTAVSGVLIGPANTMGELSLAAGVITVQPFKAVVQCSSDATAGQFIVTNDAALALTALTAQHATQYRRGLVVIDVDDSLTAGVGSSGTTDRVRVYPLDGPLAASSGATTLPALPDNSLALGEYLIPPTGQTVTITPYNPRTTLRGAIGPVLVDGLTYPGHDGAVPVYDGQYRDHPTKGLQRGAAGAWSVAGLDAPFTRLTRTQVHAIANGTWTAIFWDGEVVDTDDMWSINPSTKVYPKRNGWFEIKAGLSLGAAVNARRILQIYKNGTGVPIGRAIYQTSGQSELGHEIAGSLSLVVGDYIELFAYQDSGSSQNSDTGGAWGTTYLEAKWIRS